MNASDLRFALSGHIGFLRGYLNGMEKNIKMDIKVSLRNINELQERVQIIENIFFKGDK